MNNLMKAEWYRLRHSGNTMIFILLIGVVAVLLQFMGNDGPDATAKSFYIHSSLGMAIAVGGVTGVILSTFNNRLADYEIMKGTPPMTMILGKTLMTLTIVTVIYFLPSVAAVLINDRANLTLSMILLTYVCVIKLTVIAVSLCIMCKDAVGSVAFVMLLAFESVPLVFLQNVLGINTVPLTSYLTSTQLIIIGNIGVIDLDELSMELDTSHIGIKVIISFAVLAALMIAAAHKSLKDKWEIRLISPD